MGVRSLIRVDLVAQELVVSLLIKQGNLSQISKSNPNIRRIKIRCLSDLLKVNTRVRCSADELQKFSWSTFFNLDCTFSTHKLQIYCTSNNLVFIQQLKSVQQQLLDHLIKLDTSLFESSDSYKGQSQCYQLKFLSSRLFSIVISLLYVYCYIIMYFCRVGMLRLCIPELTSIYGQWKQPCCQIQEKS